MGALVRFLLATGRVQWASSPDGKNTVLNNPGFHWLQSPGVCTLTSQFKKAESKAKSQVTRLIDLVEQCSLIQLEGEAARRTWGRDPACCVAQTLPQGHKPWPLICSAMMDRGLKLNLLVYIQERKLKLL